MSEPPIDAILADFRTWLQQATAQGTLTSDTAPAQQFVDLHALAGHFTALRHEVNLQTKAVRAQQEQHTKTVDRLAQALDAAQQAQQRSRELDVKEREEQLRPVLKSLLDVYDSLLLARREMDRLRPEARPAGDTVEWKLPLWLRMLGLGRIFAQHGEAYRKALAAKYEAEIDRWQRLLESMNTGYTMSLQRLERTLTALELQPIPTMGEPFDPEKMEVVEVMQQPGRQNMEVIDEVRRGYFWRGRVFRFAQVRVARGC